MSSLSVGDPVSKRWASEDAWYDGRVVGLGPDGAVEVAYNDGDRETHRPDDSSWDEDDWRRRRDRPVPQDSVMHGASPAQVDTVLRHMEALLHDRLHSFLQQKRFGKTTMSSIRLPEWTRADHLLFFGHLGRIDVRSDAELTRLLSPIAGDLPVKNVGRWRDGSTRLCLCAPGAVYRAAKSTIVCFGYNQYRKVSELEWEPQWNAEIEPRLARVGRKKRQVLFLLFF